MPESISARVNGSSAAMCRYVNRINPSRRRSYSARIGSLTLSRRSLLSHTSSTVPIRAPTRSYCPSPNALPSPAPVSTTTSWPWLINSSAPAGVSATRYSSCLISLATPIRTGAEAYRRDALVKRLLHQRERHVDHRLQVGHGDPLGGRVDVGHPVGQVDDLEAALVEHVGVRRAARQLVAHLVAAPGEGRGGENDRPVGPAEAVAAVALARDRRGLALGDARGERDRVLHLLDEVGEPPFVVRPCFGDERAPLRNDVGRRAARDRSHVRGRQLVDAAEPH